MYRLNQRAYKKNFPKKKDFLNYILQAGLVKQLKDYPGVAI